MIGTILGAFRVAEIRNKILFTAGILLLYRLGTYIPAPGINSSAVKQISNQLGGNSVLGLLNLLVRPLLILLTLPVTVASW